MDDKNTQEDEERNTDKETEISDNDAETVSGGMVIGPSKITPVQAEII